MSRLCLILIVWIMFNDVSRTYVCFSLIYYKYKYRYQDVRNTFVF